LAINPNLQERGAHCVVLAVADRSGVEEEITWPWRQNSALVTPEENNRLQSENARAAGLATIGGVSRPSLVVEAELQLRGDSFVVRPVLIWYRKALPGAPNRPLPSQLHFTFTTPASAGVANQQSTFGVAVIQLPPLAPGSAPMTARELWAFSSEALALRPQTESSATMTNLSNELDGYRTRLTEISSLTRAVEAARRRAQVPNAAADTRTALQGLEERLATSEAGRPRLAARADRAMALATRGIRAGSTNVQARFAVVRNPNAFWLAVARAIQTRSTEAGTALTQELTPASPTAAWTALDTAYVTQMAGVDRAQRVLDQARIGGDPAVIFEAEQSLRLAKAAANAAAAAASRPLPYPGLD